MKFVKQSARQRPKVSLILVDWSVRESFHLLHYLSKQDVDRDSFEIVIVEYYSRVSDVIRPFEDQVDTWLLLEMPDSCYYHKHLMYNAGIVAARGEVCVICDSDAMVKEGFIRAIVTEFEKAPDIVLHLDQFRNSRRDFYPFRYPDFEEVMAAGCINNIGGKTRGLLDSKDSIHNRNYGACMCARRDDLIAIGGADEHIDYLGHICGPYDMTFRLVNLGRREIWHQTEFMCHTWHPGQDGEDNYLGPHDGRNVSTTALEALTSGREMPLVENDAVRNLRTAEREGHGADFFRIDPEYQTAWQKNRLRQGPGWARGATARKIWNGFVVEKTMDGFVAFPKLAEHPAFSQHRAGLELHAATEEELRGRVAQALPFSMRAVFPLMTLATYCSRAIGQTYLFLGRRLRRWMVMHQA